MALIKYGAIVSEARGKESGIIFSRNSYGGYIKQKVSPINPQTAYQQSVRAQLGTTAQQWSGLTATEKNDWADLGKQVLRVNRFGDQTFYTGFNLFVKVNRNRARLGLGAITTPAIVPAIPTLAFDTLTLQATGGILTTATISFSVTGGDAPAGFQVALDATMPILTGRRFVKNFYRENATYLAEATPINFLTLYVARFGSTVVPGSFIGLRARLIDEASGLDGPFAVIGGVVVGL